jgi:hypothetical protein
MRRHVPGVRLRRAERGCTRDLTRIAASGATICTIDRRDVDG